MPRDCIHFGKKLVAIERHESSATLAFADDSRVETALVIGADGIHSVVREVLFGAEKPQFTGRVAYRTVYPTVGLRVKRARLAALQNVRVCAGFRMPD